MDRRAGELAGAGEEAIRTFRILVAMVAVRAGAPRELAQGEREGRLVVIRASKEDERIYAVEDTRRSEIIHSAVLRIARLVVGGASARLYGWTLAGYVCWLTPGHPLIRAGMRSYVVEQYDRPAAGPEAPGTKLGRGWHRPTNERPRVSPLGTPFHAE